MLDVKTVSKQGFDRFDNGTALNHVTSVDHDMTTQGIVARTNDPDMHVVNTVNPLQALDSSNYGCTVEVFRGSFQQDLNSFAHDFDHVYAPGNHRLHHWTVSIAGRILEQKLLHLNYLNI